MFLFSCYIIEWILEIFMAWRFGMGFFPGGGTPLFGLHGYVPLNRLWFSRFWVLNRVYNFIIERLELGVFLEWKPFKECEDLRWAVYICNTNNFFLNIYFHDFSVKNYLILYAKQTNQCQKVVSPVLNRVAKWAIFVLNRVGVWRPRRLTSSQTSLECPPGIFWRLNFGPGIF